MQATHKIFFAIPFDAATRSMYDRVAAAVRTRFPFVATVIGTDEVGPSPKYSFIKSFRAQNRELTSQFLAQIRSADVVVADLTHNNPNVHVELGIALTENKNILRVTGRSVTELGFDVRNLEVRAYRDEKALATMVMRYLVMFFAIKRLSVSPKHGTLYYRLPTSLNLEGLKYPPFAARSPTPRSYVLRDGAIRATFEIVKAKNRDDWFGIYFRSGASPLLGSHLVYVRQNGAVELGLYPGPDIIEKWQLPKAATGKQRITIAFENDKLDIKIGGAHFKTTLLSHQSAGRILFAAWQADVTLHVAEAISRDTVEWG